MVVIDAGALWLAAGRPQREPGRAGYVFARVALPQDAQLGAGDACGSSAAPQTYTGAGLLRQSPRRCAPRCQFTGPSHHGGRLQRQNDKLLYSASDLVAFLGCQHLSTLDRHVTELSNNRNPKPRLESRKSAVPNNH